MRFSLRTLLISVLLVSSILSWLAFNRSGFLAEKELLDQLASEFAPVAEIDNSTEDFCSFGIQGYAYRESVSIPNQIMGLSAPELFTRIVELDLRSPRFNDRCLDLIAEFPHLNKLTGRNTTITADGLAQFKKRFPEVEVQIDIYVPDPDSPFG